MKKRFLFSVVLASLLLFTIGCDLIPELATEEPAETPNVVETETEEAVSVTPINPDWQSSSSKEQPAALPSIADVVARVKPSVVAISGPSFSTGYYYRVLLFYSLLDKSHSFLGFTKRLPGNDAGTCRSIRKDFCDILRFRR